MRFEMTTKEKAKRLDKLIDIGLKIKYNIPLKYYEKKLLDEILTSERHKLDTEIQELEIELETEK